MPRNSYFEVLNDTSLFDTRQMLPRTVLAQAMNGSACDAASGAD